MPGNMEDFEKAVGGGYTGRQPNALGRSVSNQLPPASPSPAPNPPQGLVSPSTGGGAESTPAAMTISHSPENRNRMGGLSNQEYLKKARITTK